MAKKKEEVKETEKEVVVDTQSIKEEVLEYVDTQLDQRFEKVFEDRFRKEFVQELDKANKKLLREKNLKIMFKNIFLILFFGIILLLLYLLYTEHYFDQYFGGEKRIDKSNIEEKTNHKDDVVEAEPTLEELIGEYGSYIDSYVISSTSSYVEDFYNGNITDEIRNYMALNSVSFESLDVEDDYNIFDFEILEEACEKLFDSKCSKKSFDYNGNKVRYFKKLDSFITNNLLTRDENPIRREIIDIKVDGKKVSITTVEGIVVDGGLYSVSPSTLIRDYENEPLKDNLEELNKVVYNFENQKLINVKKG